MKCNNCGQEIQDNEAFCGNCGAKMHQEQKKIFCANCGSEIYDNMRFCSKCGAACNFKPKVCGTEIKTKKSNTNLIIGTTVSVVALVVVIIAIIFGLRIFKKYNESDEIGINIETIAEVTDNSDTVFSDFFEVKCRQTLNKYNLGYIDVSGHTVEEVAEEAGVDYDEFLEMYGLPADMPKDTTESAAYNNIPFSVMAQTYGMETSDLKEILQLSDEVKDDTTWGEALDQATLGAYVGVDELEEFKEYYGLSDEVTANTLWGDVRKIVEEKQREERIASENTSN